MPFPKFASKDKPLRASSLPELVRCGWRAVLLAEAWIEDNSGKAADTGSALHRGAAEWHLKGKDVNSAVKALRDSIAEFPLADLDDAEKQFRAYASDPRNFTAIVPFVEKKIEIALAPAPNDPTGEMIYVNGTLDQIREAEFQSDLWEVWDLKSSARDIGSILHAYTFQLALYTLAAVPLVPPGKRLRPGGFIRTRTYLKRGVDPTTSPLGVFISVPWGLDHCDRLLDAVRNQVALIRGAGRIHLGPGEHCNYCPAKGIDTCLPLLLSKGV
jgi:hypothetical protein